MTKYIQYFTWLGNLFPQICIVSILLCCSFDKAFKLGLIWFGAYSINFVLKNTICKKRPDKKSWRIKHVNGYSFPSGHALTSMVLYWSIARIFEPSLALTIVLYALPFALGLSRLYLRVHFVEDVICAWIIAYLYLNTWL